jgi:hypothetical protein
MAKILQLTCLCLAFSSSCLAQGTRIWEQSKSEEFEKGTAHGVAINGDGSLTLAPTFDALYTTPSTYLWSVASDSHGDVFVASGSPARIYRVTPDGKAKIIFAPQELQVQAVVIDPSDVIYAATSPDGKVYRIVHGGPTPGKAPETPHTIAEVAAAQEGAKPVTEGEKPRTSVAVDTSYSAGVYFDPKTKYIWDLVLDRAGQLFVATGDRGEIFRIDRQGNGSLFFKSDEAHIRVLAFDNQDDLIAGTDGSGLVYRISPKGEGFVLYSAPKKEITALAVDGEGNIFAAGTGEKRAAPGPPPAPASAGASPGAPTLPIGTPATTGAAASPSGILFVPYQNVANVGSELYRLSPDGSPKTIWSSRDDLVYALAFDQAGQLLAGTGNKGKIYAIRGTEHTDLAKASANQVTAFAHAPKGGLYAVTSNLGKIFLLGPSTVNEGSLESDVFDAKNVSKWGRVEIRGAGNFALFARSGNVDNPDRNWSPWKKVDLQKDLPVDAPAARFLQWRAVLHPGNPAAVIDSVSVNYLPKNVAPEVDDVTVMVGQRVPAGTHTSAGAAESSPYEMPTPTVRDRHSIAVKWKAHDDNDDELTYSVYYRGDGESRWKLLRDEVDERYANLESDSFPDGGYTIRIVASDAPAHSADDALTGERTSARFEVDNTPPRIELLRAQTGGSKMQISFRAVDSFSPIKRAEYSIDAGEWQLAVPVGQISDSKVESYDFTAPIPVPDETHSDPGSPRASNAAAPGAVAAEEHTVVVRVYDRFENVGVSQTVVKGGASSKP